MLRNLIDTLFVVLLGGMMFYPAPTEFPSSTSREAGASNDCRLAISIAEAFLPEGKVQASHVKLIEVKNLLISGKDCCDPNLWQLTFLDKSLIDERGLRGKGGQIYVEVNVHTQKAKVTGWGE